MRTVYTVWGRCLITPFLKITTFLPFFPERQNSAEEVTIGAE
jgi:hypothetical protein